MASTREFSLDGADWPHRSASRRVVAAGSTWHVQQLGTGPPLLLIHGTAASTHSWAGLVDRLARSFALTLFDLPGHGFSDPLPAKDMTLPGLAERVGGLLQVLDFTPQCIVGHSAGAAIGVRMVLDRRVPAPHVVISVNGAMVPFGGVGRWLFPSAARLLSAGSFAARLLSSRARQPDAVMKMLERMGGRPPTESVAFYERLLSRPRHIQAALDMMAMWDLEALWTDLGRLAVPLHLIACGEDLAVPAETAWTIADKVGEAKVEYLRGLGHLGHEEKPEDIAKHIQAAWDAKQGRGTSGPPIGHEAAP